MTHPVFGGLPVFVVSVNQCVMCQRKLDSIGEKLCLCADHYNELIAEIDRRNGESWPDELPQDFKMEVQP